MVSSQNGTNTTNARKRYKKMNYTENNIHWQVGDIVIHDCDAKRPDMLMQIIEKYQDAHCKPRYVCAYIDKEYHIGQKGFTEKEFNKWNRWNNSMKPLHDPKRFDIIIPDNKK